MKSFRVVVGLVASFFILTVSHAIAIAASQVLTFREGDGGAYSSTHGATVDRLTGSGVGSAPTLLVRVNFQGGYDTTSLVRFPDILGGNNGQIPFGSTIEYASLQLTRANASDQEVRMFMAMRVWDEATVNGTNAPNMMTPMRIIPAGVGPHNINVTEAVQLWALGTANGGFRMTTLYDVENLFYSDDEPNVELRPLLTVFFTPAPLATQSTTWGKVKALYR